ncbi:hypothetical protein PQR46_36745 [Paraburkholderia sediminicola]|uniref:hypothetical protein n=1 Tax=Paraburkholderia TaxID=1822464 RepID=UPI0038B867F1
MPTRSRRTCSARGDDDVAGALEGPAREGDVERGVCGSIADNTVVDGSAGDADGVDGAARGVKTGALGVCGLITDNPVVDGGAGRVDGAARGVETGERGVCGLIVDSPADVTGVTGAGAPQPRHGLTGKGAGPIGLPAPGGPASRGGGVRNCAEGLETLVDGTAEDAGRAPVFGCGAAGCGLPPLLPGVLPSTYPPRVTASFIVSARSYSINGRDALENNR